ncbi:hypothetical protein [Oceanicoccus sagamiensis]|uniref:Uncharacterized protein n=1 Tax=Oceanicoccus sagamiensis TaxID=716816 RepID=A0A1X9N6V2_9GAMM|nr:hypothetical protein [Oceanicoccus sagamiensis]ARN73830.1 hypothetical protein BST96_06705 [Oceanicoccus sagamiensis]
METSNVPVIGLNGTPRERGRIYGETAKPLINELVKNWHTDLGNLGLNSITTKSLNADEYLSKLLSRTPFYGGTPCESDLEAFKFKVNF